MLKNAYFLAKFGFDTAENEPAKNSRVFLRFHRDTSSSFLKICKKICSRRPLPQDELFRERLTRRVERELPTVKKRLREILAELEAKHGVPLVFSGVEPCDGPDADSYDSTCVKCLWDEMLNSEIWK